jgi:phospholipid/cholesterol/gamma-HCH transport system substrate-binding protein
MRGESRKTPNWLIGLICVIVIAIGSWVAFTKQVPWGGGTTYDVVFNSAQNIRADSPVRIAGVDVGQVKGVEALAQSDNELLAQSDADTAGAGDSPPVTGAVVSIELEDAALPLKQDATFKLRPRLFLEGNLFIELRPGSPSAPEADEGYTFPPQQTSNSVQLNEFMTGSLQRDSRQNLRVFLDQFGEALIDRGGAESFQTVYRTSKGAFRSTSQVSEALLGENPHDLSGLIRNLDRVIRGLGRNEGALQDTVTNLATVTGSLAAEDQALEQAIIELPQVLDAADPAFASLNRAFPPVRALAREALPGVRSTEPMLIEATPLLQQVRLLSRPAELRGLVADLVPTVPRLARLTRDTQPFLEQTRALSSCFNNVIIPWSNDTVDGGPDYNSTNKGPAGTVAEETAYGLVGISGESRSGDANGQYIRVAGGGGLNTVQLDTPTGSQFGVTQFPLEGSMPPKDSSLKTPYRPNRPCENQDPPDLRAVTSGLGPTPTQAQAETEVPEDSREAQRREDAGAVLESLDEARRLEEDGERAEARQAAKRAERELDRFNERYGS